MFEILKQSLWIVSSLMIFLCGLYFCFKLNFIHLNFKEMLRAIFKKQTNSNSISSFQALSMSLARQDWWWFSCRNCTCRIFRRSTVLSFGFGLLLFFVQQILLLKQFLLYAFEKKILAISTAVDLFTLQLMALERKNLLFSMPLLCLFPILVDS